jgi:activating signal cointegrator complex subunit 3
VKEEGWFVVLGDPVSGELLALKRVSVSTKGKTRTTVLFPEKDEQGEAVAKVDVFLLSDSYIGLDQVMQVSVDAYGKSDSTASYMRGPWKALDGNRRSRKGSARSQRSQHDNDLYGAEEVPEEPQYDF